MNEPRPANEPRLILYELAGSDPQLRFSPHCWKIRMALAHKGLQADRRPWRFTDKEAIAFSGQGLVPVLIDGAHVVSDSWRIALHLEERFANSPALFGAPQAAAVTRFVNSWADTALLPAVSRLILLDIYNVLDQKDRDYFRATREQRFGKTLEQVVQDQQVHLERLRHTLTPLRHLLGGQAYLGGKQPNYADYCVFGMFMWARCTSAIEFLAADDTIYAWRERLLDLFDGLARQAPHHKANPELPNA
ncbi:glutathione S-transferase family protein [Labrys neptuniae]